MITLCTPFWLTICMVCFASSAAAQCRSEPTGRWSTLLSPTVEDCVAAYGRTDDGVLVLADGSLSTLEFDDLATVIRQRNSSLRLERMEFRGDRIFWAELATNELPLPALGVDCEGFRELAISAGPCGYDMDLVLNDDNGPIPEQKLIEDGWLWDQSVSNLPKIEHSVSITDGLFPEIKSIWLSNLTVVGDTSIHIKEMRADGSAYVTIQNCVLAGNLTLSFPETIHVSINRCLILGDLTLTTSKDVSLSIERTAINGSVSFDGLQVFELDSVAFVDIKGDLRFKDITDLNGVRANYMKVGGDVRFENVVESVECLDLHRPTETFETTVGGTVSIADSSLRRTEETFFGVDMSSITNGQPQFYLSTCQ